MFAIDIFQANIHSPDTLVRYQDFQHVFFYCGFQGLAQGESAGLDMYAHFASSLLFIVI